MLLFGGRGRGRWEGNEGFFLVGGVGISGFCSEF